MDFVITHFVRKSANNCYYEDEINKDKELAQLAEIKLSFMVDPSSQHQLGVSNLAEHNFVDLDLEEPEVRASPLKDVDLDDDNNNNEEDEDNL